MEEKVKSRRIPGDREAFWENRNKSWYGHPNKKNKAHQNWWAKVEQIFPHSHPPKVGLVGMPTGWWRQEGNFNKYVVQNPSAKHSTWPIAGDPEVFHKFIHLTYIYWLFITFQELSLVNPMV